MSDHVVRPDFQGPPLTAALREKARELTGYWWVLLVAGVAWTVIALVILQFDQASITTVGILVGLMFTFAGILNIALASVKFDVPEDERKSATALRWVSGIFGVLFLVCAVICFVNPKNTFAGMADILGFLFLLIGLWWMFRAFLERPVNPTWWLGLISGILMTCLAFWTSGQFFIHKAYLLLIFAGIWALMEGITNIVRAFEVRRLHEEL